MRVREITLPPASEALGELAETVLDGSPWWCRYWRAGSLTNTVTSQAHILGFGLAHPQINLIYELLKCVKRQVLLILHDTRKQQDN